MKAIAMGLAAAVLFSMLPSSDAHTGRGGWVRQPSSTYQREVFKRPDGCTLTVITPHKLPTQRIYTPAGCAR